MNADRLYFLAACALVCAAAMLSAVVPSDAAARAASEPASGFSCGAEDDATWRWSRCGNLRRGVVTLHGDFRVVGPCRFARLWEAGELRYRVRVGGTVYRTLKRLPGDGYARRHGCSVPRNPGKVEPSRP